MTSIRKYCRICWNTRYWREPTGEAQHIEVGKSYVREHGFGHEEWLFNFSWLQPSSSGGVEQFKYGFLQPIGKYRSRYEGKTLHVLLYTVSPDLERIAVAEIKDVFVPELKELGRAVALMRRRGWLRQMREELSHLNISPVALQGPPDHIINVRFKPAQVNFFDPLT